MSYSTLPYHFLPKNVVRLTFALDPRLSSDHLISIFMLRLTCKQNTPNPKHAYILYHSMSIQVKFVEYALDGRRCKRVGSVPLLSLCLQICRHFQSRLIKNRSIICVPTILSMVCLEETLKPRLKILTLLHNIC